MKYLNHLLRRYGLLVLLTVLGILAGGVYDLVTTPTYVAKSSVVVSAGQGDSPSAINFAQAYGRIVTTQSVIGLAAGTLGSSDGLSDVTAASSPDSPVVEITATGRDAKRTAAVANAMAEALVTYGSSRSDATHVTLSVFAKAAVPGKPVSPKPPLEPAIGGAAGALVGGLALLAGISLARTRKRPAGLAGPEHLARGYPVAPLALPPATHAVPPATHAVPPASAVLPPPSPVPPPVSPVLHPASPVVPPASPVLPPVVDGVSWPAQAGNAAWPDPAGNAAWPAQAGNAAWPPDPPVPDQPGAPPAVGRAVVIYREEPQ